MMTADFKTRMDYFGFKQGMTDNL